METGAAGVTVDADGQIDGYTRDETPKKNTERLLEVHRTNFTRVTNVKFNDTDIKVVKDISRRQAVPNACFKAVVPGPILEGNRHTLIALAEQQARMTLHSRDGTSTAILVPITLHDNATQALIKARPYTTDHDHKRGVDNVITSQSANMLAIHTDTHVSLHTLDKVFTNEKSHILTRTATTFNVDNVLKQLREAWTGTGALELTGWPTPTTTIALSSSGHLYVCTWMTVRARASLSREVVEMNILSKGETEMKTLDPPITACQLNQWRNNRLDWHIVRQEVIMCTGPEKRVFIAFESTVAMFDENLRLLCECKPVECITGTVGTLSHPRVITKMTAGEGNCVWVMRDESNTAALVDVKANASLLRISITLPTIGSGRVHMFRSACEELTFARYYADKDNTSDTITRISYEGLRTRVLAQTFIMLSTKKYGELIKRRGEQMALFARLPFALYREIYRKTVRGCKFADENP